MVGVVTEDPGQSKPRVRYLSPRFDKLGQENDKPFAWGKLSGHRGAQLAFALLCDVLGDDKQARQLHVRLKWRVVAELDPKAGWIMSPEDILAAVADIRSVEDDKAIRENVKKVAQEPRPVEHEAGRGVVAGSRIVWDTNDKGDTITHKEDE